MYSLGEIKSKLDNIYNNLDNIEKFGIDVSDYKNQINDFDLMCEKFDSDSNTAVQIKFDKNQKKEFEILNKSIILLEKHIIGINKSLGLINYINETNIDKNTSKETINDIVAHILDYLLTINQFKNILNPELFDPIMEKLYQIIKYEFKYNGKSLILDYMYPNLLLTNKFFEIWKNDYEKHNEILKDINDVGNLYEYKYYLNSTIFTIAIKEDGYLKEKEDELNTLIKKHEIDSRDKIEAEKTLKEKEKINKNRKKSFAVLYSRILPVFVSLGILVGANIGANHLVKNNSKYKITKEYYSTISNETTTTEEYGKLSVGDISITMYYPTDEKNARIIKQYSFNDNEFDINKSEEYNYDSIDFSSSTYRVDNESNQKSTDMFIEAEKVTNIDQNDKNISTSSLIFASIIASAATILLDLAANKIISGGYYEDNIFFLTDLFNTYNSYTRYYKKEKVKINKKYPKQSLGYSKILLNEKKKSLKKLEGKYKELYSKYEYMDNYLQDDGYSRKLK